MQDKSGYVSPFSTRYASNEMQYLFSERYKFTTWRRLWCALAECEHELGLDVTLEQIAEMKAHIEDIDFECAEAREREVRHDVMSHVFAYGKQCPGAEPIIHLGATSCFVGDNTDLIIMREATKLIIAKVAQVIKNLSGFALKYKDLPCLGYTHLQPAQLTTVGKRASLWINDLAYDVAELEHRLDTLVFRGVKGTTGTQASFLDLFNGDADKVKKLDSMVAAKMGFECTAAVCGQTYSRKIDSFFVNALSGVAQSAYKFANDMRLLQSFEELEEPFETSQIGSSAMPYKRNPMRCERISALARYLIADAVNPAMTAGTQWLERTLDDSANRRISVAEAFLCADAILNIYLNVSSGIVVYDKVIERRVMEKLPFMATENIMMEAVKKGGNRQELHEKLRVYSHRAATAVKLEGKPNELISLIAADEAFKTTEDEIRAGLDPSRYVGRAPQQTEEFVRDTAQPIIDKYCKAEIVSELKV